MACQSRRTFLAMGAASVALPAVGQTEPNDISTTEIEREVSQTVRHNASSFRALDWEPYFSNLKNGAVLVDISLARYILVRGWKNL